MTTVATLQTNMSLNSSAFRAGMVQAAATANQSLGSIQTQAAKTASVLLSLKRAAETFGSFYLLKEGIASLLEAQVQLQQIQFTLVSATNSVAAAGQAFSYLRDQSEKLGLNLQPTSQEFAKLAAAAEASGVPLGKTEALFTAFGQASTVMHLSTIQSQRALLALTEMMSRGTIQSRQLNQQLGQAIPGSAARFQNAVMKAVAGTDLAGKSFLQLEKSGALITSKFLPQLTEALAQSGKGWEEASQGLNSQLNRVQTAWFNLKTEVSGGLFNDVATGSAKLLADNLTRVAGAIELVAVAGLARVASNALGSIGTKVAAVASTRASDVASAEATQARTQETMGLVVAQQRQAEGAARQAGLDVIAQKNDIASLQTTNMRTAAIERLGIVAEESASAQAQSAAALAITQQRQAEATVRQAFAEVGLRQAEVANVATVDLRAAALERLGLAVEAEVQANTALYVSNQQVTKTTIAAAEAEAGVRAAALERLNLATVAEAKANMALFLSNQQVRGSTVAAGEAEVALGAARARTTLGGVAKGIGNSLLGLVGGGTGAAVLGIGLMAAAFFSARSEAEKLTEETKATAKSIETEVMQADQLTASYKELGNSDPLSVLRDSMESLGKELEGNRVKIQAQSDALADMSKRAAGKGTVLGIDTSGIQGASLALAAYSFVMDRLTGKQKELTDSTAGLESGQSMLQARFDAQNAELVEKYGTAFAGVRDQIAQTTWSIGGLLPALSKLGVAWQAALAKEPEIDAARADYKKYADGVLTDADRLEKELRQKSMTNAQRVADDHKQAMKKNAIGNVGGEDPAVAAAYARELAAAKGLDALKRPKADPALEQFKSLTAEINNRIEQDKEAADSTDKLTAAQKLQIKVDAEFAAGKTKMTKVQQAQIDALLATAVAQGEVTKKTLQQRDADKNLLILQQQLAEKAQAQARTQARALDAIGHGSQWQAQQAGLDSIRDAYDQLKVAADKAYEAEKRQNGDSAILMKSHEDQVKSIAAAEDAALKNRIQGYADEQKAQADSMNGMKAAVEDFMTTQQNMAELTKQATTQAIAGFSDAFANFAAGTESGKQAFGSFIDSMYLDAWKFLANKAIQSIFDSFGLSDKPTAGSTAGGWGSMLGNLGNALGLSWGPGTIGAGLTNGGSVAPNSFHPVLENGPELYTEGGRSYLMGGDRPGKVTPMTTASNASTYYVTNINVQPTSTRQTANQIANANARAQRIASSRN